MLKRVQNPPNRYHRDLVEWIDSPPEQHLEVYEETAKSIVTENKSPDIGFRYSINPYRGCFHACAYCYARPTHQYLDYGAGTDFERKIIVKRNAAELLEERFNKKSWQGERIMFSGITDCYQPLEASYEITRSCLKVFARYKNPVGIITKGALIRRDLDLLTELNRTADVSVYMSIAFADDAMSKLLEPNAPRPSVRFRAMKELTDAGILVGVGVAPVIPGLNDTQIPEVLERASACGAKTAFMTLLRLPAEVEPVFIERLREAFPTRADKVLNGVRAMKDGALNRSDFGKRFRGDGERWEAIEWIFESQCKKFGINKRNEDALGEAVPKNTFSRPNAQLSLF